MLSLACKGVQIKSQNELINSDSNRQMELQTNFFLLIYYIRSNIS